MCKAPLAEILPFVDLGRQYSRLKPEIDAGIQRVLDHGRFILGPEVREFAYDLARGAYVPAVEVGAPERISGFFVRQAIREDKLLPDWFMRDIIQDYLRAKVSAGWAIVSN